MNRDSNAILTLCSHICVGEGVTPLEPKEYSELAQRLSGCGKTPGDLFTLAEEDYLSQLGLERVQAERLMRLLDRNASLIFALEEYENMGILAVTRADTVYPKKLKKKLANTCPPIFYCAGDLSLAERNCIGYVGSRTMEATDLEFTVGAVRKTVSRGYGVVSGGAKGVDTVAETEALRADGFSVEYLSDSLLKKLRSSDTIRSIQKGKLLLLSVGKPDAGFQVGLAMMRNRYIYAQSCGTVIVRSDLNKGGTWAGAVENLRHNWCPTLCRKHPYPGNLALLEKGAIPIDDGWDGTIPAANAAQEPQEIFEQTSLFELL